MEQKEISARFAEPTGDETLFIYSSTKGERVGVKFERVEGAIVAE
jgi:hypothetical protein